MDEMTSRVKFEGDNGESFEMIVLKEFDYKKRRFAVLMEDGCNCHCNDDSCTCNHEGKEDKCTRIIIAMMILVHVIMRVKKINVLVMSVIVMIMVYIF